MSTLTMIVLISYFSLSILLTSAVYFGPKKDPMLDDVRHFRGYVMLFLLSPLLLLFVFLGMKDK